LELEFEQPVSKRTVENWVAGFKANGNTRLDAPFHWQDIDSYAEFGLPWEAGAFINEMWFAIEQDVLMLPLDGEDYLRVVPPTVRRARWWWRIHQACPEITAPRKGIWPGLGRDFGPLDLAFLAENFLEREVAHDVLGLPLDMDGFAALIRYKPWLTQSRFLAYIKASLKDRRLMPRGPIIELLDLAKIIEGMGQEDTDFDDLQRDRTVVSRYENQISSELVALESQNYPVRALLYSQRWAVLMVAARKLAEESPELFHDGVPTEDVHDKVNEMCLRVDLKHFGIYLGSE